MGEPCLAIIAHKKHCRRLRAALESMDALERSLQWLHLPETDEVALPCRDHRDRNSGATLESRLAARLRPEVEGADEPEKRWWRMETVTFVPDRRRSGDQILTQSRKLSDALRRFAEGKLQGEQCWTTELERGVPEGWERHGDLVLLRKDSFRGLVWESLAGTELWSVVSEALGVRRLARRTSGTRDDAFRTPRVELLLGDDGWVAHVDNRISYHFDVTRCMFSAGNVSEKLRVARMDCRGQVVVDMFAGIGYFTLPYLVHAGAELVHACEWNPDALSALERTLNANGVRHRCVVHAGDNRQMAPSAVAQRVNLGLIPSSRDSWQAACRALDPCTGGWLHVHGNVDSSSGLERCDTWRRWAEETRDEVSAILRRDCATAERQWRVDVEHVECVKSYAPHVHHLVVDLHCLSEIIGNPPLKDV